MIIICSIHKHSIVCHNVPSIHFQEWNITRLSYEYDSEPFGKERDAAIKKLASEAGVEVTVRISHTLYDLDKYVLCQSSNHYKHLPAAWESD